MSFRRHITENCIKEFVARLYKKLQDLNIKYCKEKNYHVLITKF